MSEALDLLNGLTDEQIAMYGAAGTEEPHIVVGSDRKIIIPDSLKRLAVQFDHDIETVTFDCPRYWDEHDMSQMAVYVNYKCSDRYEGAYHVKNIVVDDNDDTLMHFEWIISRNVTRVDGKIEFSVSVNEVNDDGEEINHWSSEICTDAYISKGLNSSQDVVHSNPDILAEVLLLESKAEALYDATMTRSGVYVGSGEMPEWADVQIDPNGESSFDVNQNIANELNALTDICNRNSKRITNLEKGLPDDSFQTDSSVAYSKTVPENALPYAEVGVVGGVTYKVNIGTEENPEYELQHSAVTAIESSNSETVLSALIIPEEVKALDGYGWGINESVYNYVDWEKKQFVKCVGVVDLGTLNWSLLYTSVFYTSIDKAIGLSNMLFYNESMGSQISPVTASEKANILTHKYKTCSNGQLATYGEGFAISFYIQCL